jgi:ApeA N-terminal domain 1
MTNESRVTLRGRWWVPASSDTTVPGVLTILPGRRPRLEVDDRIWPCTFPVPTPGKPVGIRFEDLLRSTSIIHGQTVDDQAVTLVNAHEIHVGANGVILSATHALLGAHIPAPDAAAFQSLAGHFTHLDEWAATNGFSVTFLPEGGSRIEHHRPPTITAALSEEFSFELGWDFEGPTLQTPQTECSITERAVVQLTATTGATFDALLTAFDTMRKFIVLGIGAPVRITMLRATLPNAKKSVMVYNSLITDDPPSASLMTHEMLFTFPGINDRLADMLQRWTTKQSLLGPIYNLYVGTIMSTTMFVEHQFTSFFQAIESYHRRTTPAVTSKKRVSANERLTAVIATRNAGWLFSAPLDAAIKHLVAVRDYFTHYLPHMDQRVPEPADLYNLTIRLRTLLEMVLLHELGLDDAAIKERITSTRRLERHLVQPQ